MLKPKPKLAIVISHPIQHWVPVYQALTASQELIVKVFFVAENGAHEHYDAQFAQKVQWDLPLLDGYDSEFLTPGKILEDFGFFSVDDKNIRSQLQRFSPDFVWVHGYAQRINWRSISAVKKQAKFIYTSDSNVDDQRAWWRKALKRTVVKTFLNKCHYFLSCSPKNRAYLIEYGVSEAQIIDTAFPIDMARWQHQAAQIDDSQNQALRDQLGLAADHRVVLFAGKLIDHKRPQDLLEAIHLLREQKVSALMVGSGDKRAELERLVEQYQLQDRVKFTGFVNQSALADYFSVADIFVFPSNKEPYGAIASEVLPFGLPIIATRTIGAVGASIKEKENALLYSWGDTRALADNIQCLLSDPALYTSLSVASKALADKHDKHVMASDIQAICTRECE